MREPGQLSILVQPLALPLVSQLVLFLLLGVAARPPSTLPWSGIEELVNHVQVYRDAFHGVSYGELDVSLLHGARLLSQADQLHYVNLSHDGGDLSGVSWSDVRYHARQEQVHVQTSA